MSDADMLHKRVLLVAPKFFGYEVEIQKELEKRGAEVIFLSDRPFSSSVLKAVARVFRPAISWYSEKKLAEKIRGFGGAKFDIVFVVIGEAFTPTILKQIRRQHPGAKFVLYMWDSFDNKKYIKKNLAYFDVVSTFDRGDASSYNLKFRPLFYVPGYSESEKIPSEFDLSFVGTAHSDRYQVVKSVRAALPPNVRTFFFLFLQAPWVYTVRRLLDRKMAGSQRKDFSFDSISKDRVQLIFSQSLAILDIEHPKQTGLTMRTFEALGAEKKLITTNPQVVDYDFYDPANILVFKRGDKLKVPDDFFSTPYKPLSKSLKDKYSLSGWLDEVLGL